jgi:hypothetical protein
LNRTELLALALDLAFDEVPSLVVLVGWQPGDAESGSRVQRALDLGTVETPIHLMRDEPTGPVFGFNPLWLGTPEGRLSAIDAVGWLSLRRIAAAEAERIIDPAPLWGRLTAALDETIHHAHRWTGYCAEIKRGVESQS